MSITILGLLVALLGLVALARPLAMTVRVALILSLLGSGAAIFLPALGGASILAGVFFTGFVILRMSLLPNGPQRMLYELMPFSPGFWLLCAVSYGVFSAFFIAPLFYGQIMVAPISRSSEAEISFSAIPLQMTSGNLTQSVYAIGQVLLFAAMAAALRNAKARRAALDGLVLLGCLHVLVSFLDLATFATRTSFLIDWLRTSSYITWQNASIGGLKRISGLFPEASMYAIYAMGISGILLSLRLNRHRPRLTGPLLYVSLGFLLLSTSSTAYVALGIAAALLVLAALLRLMRKKAGLLSMLLQIGGAALFALTVIAILVPSFIDEFLAMIDETVFNKATSLSARDRSQLNALAFQAYFESWGLGLGLGSARTSSFLVTLLSNLGTVGTIAWAIFFLRCAVWAQPLQSPGGPTPTQEDFILRRAAQSGMIGCVIGASVSLHVFELGTLVYILAAMTLPVRERVTLAATRPVFQASRAGEATTARINASAAPSQL